MSIQEQIEQRRQTEYENLIEARGKYFTDGEDKELGLQYHEPSIGLAVKGRWFWDQYWIVLKYYKVPDEKRAKYNYWSVYLIGLHSILIQLSDHVDSNYIVPHLIYLYAGGIQEMLSKRRSER